jgi:hypothetical protein
VKALEHRTDDTKYLRTTMKELMWKRASKKKWKRYLTADMLVLQTLSETTMMRPTVSDEDGEDPSSKLVMRRGI